MHLLSPKTFTAIEAVLYIACQAGGAPVRSKDICAYQGVTLRYLEQILQALVRGGVLRGMRGPSGGYVLARERRNITLKDIETAMGTLTAETPSTVSPLYATVLHPLEAELRQSAQELLSARTLQDLCDKAGGSKPSSRPDFTI